MVAITALYAAPLAILFLWLSIRVIGTRRSELIGLGDGGNKSLMKRMRAQANCAEYVPIGIVVLALVELQGGPALLVHALGATLLIGRMLHGWGFSASPPNMMGRQVGMLMTLTSIAGSAVSSLILALT